ncbi:MAG TPA: hypothetical protein VIJ85_02585 [Rhizomicrobium sp.]
MRRALIVLAAALAGFGGHAIAADTDAMAKTVRGFYAAYQTFHPSDGIPGADGRAKYAPYTSASLNALLVQAAGAEDQFVHANKDSPPLIEGDLFSSNFEGATSIKVGACSGDGKTGRCAIDLTYADGKDKPLNWTDTAYLANGADGWRVDDIGYGGNGDFGNKGRMRDTLKMAISEAAD